ncbi:MAG: hypothetical protein BRD25_04535 [Bacteroidetes bacterium QH_1_61_8]|nr:MAG: hypothetical protein BRD25_04535 [Bacteroidetes bacterium QH_1_61_8]
MESTDSSPSLVPPSLQTLLGEILDYAGLFPPADLSLPRAMQNYADYREEREAWMLSRFVLPVRRLSDLTPFQRHFSGEDPYRFSVLGTGGNDQDAFLNALDRDLEVIDAFDEEYGGRAEADIMEVPIPSSLIGSARADVASFLEAVDQHIVEAGTAQLDFFFELPLRAEAVDQLPAICAAVADHNSAQAVPARSTVGLKMRCGGAEPKDVPSLEHAAALITACRDAGVPFKATAGLHHPIRHYDDGLDTEMHGFINIFAASVLAAEHRLDADQVRAILAEDAANNFRFEKEAFSWKELGASIEGIRHTRQHLALSFGSCSFEEPIDHLRDLDML